MISLPAALCAKEQSKHNNCNLNKSIFCDAVVGNQ